METRAFVAIYLVQQLIGMVNAALTAVSFAAGLAHTCARLSNNEIRCW